VIPDRGTLTHLQEMKQQRERMERGFRIGNFVAWTLAVCMVALMITGAVAICLWIFRNLT
jgi:heme/copper-type cytochrome/quinol oxidase subunit 2